MYSHSTGSLSAFLSPQPSAPTTSKTVRVDGIGSGAPRVRQGRSRRPSGTTTGNTGSNDRNPVKRGGVGGAGGGSGRGGKRGGDPTIIVQGSGGGNQGREKMAGKAANISRSSKGDANRGSGGGDGGDSSVGGRAHRDRGAREADGSDKGSKPTALGASSGVNIGGGSVVSGKTARTPPRNQRPKPPDAKDFTRLVMGVVKGVLGADSCVVSVSTPCILL